MEHTTHLPATAIVVIPPDTLQVHASNEKGTIVDLDNLHPRLLDEVQWLRRGWLLLSLIAYRSACCFAVGSTQHIPKHLPRVPILQIREPTVLHRVAALPSELFEPIIKFL